MAWHGEGNGGRGGGGMPSRNVMEWGKGSIRSTFIRYSELGFDI
jgi:hypothetical protein